MLTTVKIHLAGRLGWVFSIVCLDLLPQRDNLASYFIEESSNFDFMGMSPP
jgi:hypothetical protein